MRATLRLGTRGSALALWQSRHVAAAIRARVPGLDVELVEIVSTGDAVIDVPLSTVEGTGFFTASLERALLDGRVDLAVHSCKDLPVAETASLAVAAVLPRGPIEDVLVARDGGTLATLPPGARVGTCSLRRAAQVRARRPDVDIVALRGNVPTRVARVTSGELDAIVLARAGLVRLGLDAHVTETFDAEAVLPAPAQGAIAVQCRADDRSTLATLAALDDPRTRAAITAERTVLHVLGGGCSVPVGATASVGPEGVTLTAAVFDLAGTKAIRARRTAADAIEAGLAVADDLLAAGAAAVLDAARAEAVPWPTPSLEAR